jgi:hypothetical protein
MTSDNFTTEEENAIHIEKFREERETKKVECNSSIVSCAFVAVVIFLPSRCLAMTGGYSYRHTN